MYSDRSKQYGSGSDATKTRHLITIDLIISVTEFSYLQSILFVIQKQCFRTQGEEENKYVILFFIYIFFLNKVKNKDVRILVINIVYYVSNTCSK